MAGVLEGPHHMGVGVMEVWAVGPQILGSAVHDSSILQQSLGEVDGLGGWCGALWEGGVVLHLGVGLISSPFSLEFLPDSFTTESYDG